MTDAISKKLDILFSWKGSLGNLNKAIKSVGSLKANMMNLTKGLNKNTSAYNKLDKAVGKIQTNMGEMLKTIKDQRRVINKYGKDLQFLREEKNRLSRAVAGLRTRSENLKVKLAETRTEMRMMKKDITMLVSSNDKLYQKVKKLETQVKEITIANRAQAKSARNLERENKKLERSQSKLSSSNRTLSTSTTRLGRAYNKTKKEADAYYINSERIRGRTQGWRHGLGMIRNELLLLAFAFGGVVRTMGRSVEASTKLENSLIGLRAVAEKTGESFFVANKFVQEFTESGLLSVADASASLKNLLSAGFGMNEAISLLRAGADAAAFNRQGTLSLGQAVVGFTQGIKNQNSIMVDNAGITKNLSIMYKEYASTIGKSAMTLSEVEKRQAILNGILREARVYTGNLALMTTTYSGATEALSQSVFMTQASFGDMIKKGLKPVINQVNILVNRFKKFIEQNEVIIRSELRGFFEDLTSAVKGTWYVMRGLNNVLKTVGTSLKDVVVFGSSFIVLNKVLGKARGLIPKLIAAFTGLATTLKSVYKGFAVFTGAKGAATAAKFVGKLTIETRKLSGALRVLGFIFKALGGWVTVLLTIVASLVGWWFKHRSEVRKNIEEQRKLIEEKRKTIKTNHEESLSWIELTKDKLKNTKITEEHRKELEKQLKVLKGIEVFNRRARAGTMIDEAAEANLLEKVDEDYLRRAKSSTRIEKMMKSIQEREKSLNALMKEKLRIQTDYNAIKNKEDEKIDDEIKKKTKALEILKFIVDYQKETGNQIDDNNDKLSGTAKSLKSLLLLIEDLKGKINGMTLKGVALELNNFKTEIGKLDVKLKEFIRTLGDQAPKEIKVLADLIAQYSELKGGQLLQDRAQELNLKASETSMNKMTVTVAGYNNEVNDLNTELIQALSQVTSKSPSEVKSWINIRDEVTKYNNSLKALDSTKIEFKAPDMTFDPYLEETGRVDFTVEPILNTDKLDKRSERLKDLKELETMKVKDPFPNFEENKKKMKEFFDSIGEEFPKGIKDWEDLREAVKRYEDTQKEIIAEQSFKYIRDQRDELQGLKQDYLEKTDAITALANEELNRYDQMTQRLANFRREQNLLLEKGIINEDQYKRNLLEGERLFEEQKFYIMQEYFNKRVQLRESEIQDTLNMLETLAGGWQNLGEGIFDYTHGTEKEMEERIARQRDLLDRGQIDVVQYEDRVSQIQKAADKDRDAARAKFVANMIRQSTQIVSRHLIEAGVSAIASAQAQAAQAQMWAAFFTTQAGIMASNPATAAFAPAFLQQAASEQALAGASIAGGIGMAALGVGVGVAGGWGAAAIEANNPGSEGGFLGTPTEDVFEDRKKRLGGSIKAQEIHLSINPVTYIQAEGNIFIGEGITIDTFRGLVNEAFVQRTQEAIETGELELDSIITKES